MLQLQHDVPGIPAPNEVSLLLDDGLPPEHLVTSALGLFFLDGRLLMPRLVSRGWDIPGGHVEPGESPEETVRREVLEETGAQVDALCILGHQKIVIHAPRPEGYKYPYPVSFQVFYCGTVTELMRFAPTPEVHERRLFSPEEARELAWVQANRPLFEHAYAQTAAT